MTIIDGNNLLWALRQSFDEREIVSEIELCRVLNQYFSQIGEPGQIVFDGSGPSDKSQFDTVGHLEVFFAGFKNDSDTVIEEKITVNTAPRRLTVVSSDRRLRKAASARQAASVKSEEFWTQVRRELGRRKPRVKEPDEKRQGLSEGETDKWLEAFGLDE